MRSTLSGFGVNTALVILFSLVVTACGGGSDNPDNGSPSPVPTTTPSPTPTVTPTPTITPTPTATPTPTITPTPGGNQNPVADAGDNQFVLSGNTVDLDGSASNDPDGEITGFLWQQTSGEIVDLTNANTAVAQFTAPQVTTATEYTFQLTVTDNQGATAVDTVIVTVNPPVSSGVSGLEARPENTTCLAGDAPENTSSIDVERVFPNLSFNSPVALLQAPGDNSRWFVLEQAGRILAFSNNNSVTTVSEFADLTDRVNASANESGLLAMAFHPNFNTNGEVFLFYQTSEDGGGCCVSQLVRYTSDDGGITLNRNSAEVLISFTPPFENHFGGQLGFDEEGYLYLSIGDGGGGGDPHERAQDTSNIWGSILRIDVDSGSPYGFPPDNPFAGETALCNSDSSMADRTAACPEIYAWGLRNPWRWSFDRATGDLWLADVGQDSWEEVNIIQRGGNYGWDIREGAHCHEPSTGCETSGLIDPVAEVAQPELQSITGGYVYRGSNIPSLAGKYVFSDYRTGPIYALAADGSGGWEIEKLILSTGFNTTSFAEDQFGELYVLTYGDGIYRIIAGAPTSGPTVPELLSQTGCVDPEDPTQPASGLIPYDINAGFWSDGAVKQRWLALPEGQQISIDEQQDWQLPIGSVLMKSFWLNDQLIETRLLKHHNDGAWAGYTYAWNSGGTDADLVRGGSIVNIDGQNWIYPSGSQCMECHTDAAGGALGPETAQVNKPFTYPQTGITANQLTTLESIAVLNESPQDIALANPHDAANSLDARARAYLHTNCSQCHRPGGNINLNMDLRYSTSLEGMNICNVEPQNGNMEIADARRLAPGEADRSVLLARMNLRNDVLQMPPIGSNLVDTEGVALIREWINSFPASTCP